MYVVAFDRDQTIDVNPHPSREAVPLEWVRYLAAETDHEVWAIGNQDLTDEVDIPGLTDAVRQLSGAGTLPETVERDLPERWDAATSPLTRWIRRGDRVRLLEDIHPDAAGYLVVDDADLSYLEGWQHYYPWDFVAAVRSGDLDLGLPSR